MPPTERSQQSHLEQETRRQLQAWNAVHGTELTLHDDLLSAEDAERINNHYSVELYFGAHGIISDEDPDDVQMSAESMMLLPSQKDYEQVAAVIDGMGPRDTLFLERYGFDQQYPLPQLDVDAQGSDLPEDADRATREAYEFFKGMFQSSDAANRLGLEKQRHNYEISVWQYARDLAWLKGVRLVYADSNAFQEDRNHQDISEKDLHDLMLGTEEERAQAERIHEARELDARNIVKDEALRGLPAGPEPISPISERPRLVVLFGSVHAERLEQAFNSMGIQVSAHVMESSDFDTRAAEQHRYRHDKMQSDVGAAVMAEIVEANGLRGLPQLPRIPKGPEAPGRPPGSRSMRGLQAREIARLRKRKNNGA